LGIDQAWHGSPRRVFAPQDLLLGIAGTPVISLVRRTNRVLLYVLPQPRSMLDIARPANAALLANFHNWLNDFDKRSLAAAYLAPSTRGNALDSRMFRQCMQV